MGASVGSDCEHSSLKLHFPDKLKIVNLPRLYAILDASFFPNPDAMFRAAEQLVAGGCTFIQYRNKSGNARIMLDQALTLKNLLAGDVPLLAEVAGSGKRVRLIMNDRADLCLAADFDGVHVGQDDLSPESVRQIIGPGDKENARWLGVSTHNPEQLRDADRTSADYLAIGPIFATSSKANPDPVVGVEGVRRARALTRKPLVAIGGITRANAASVIEAGADSVAVISDLLRDGPGSIRKSAEEFFRILR